MTVTIIGTGTGAFTDAQKTAWATYRQALRDIPQTFADPANVVWPTPPA